MTISGSTPLQNLPVPIGTDAPPDVPLVLAALAGAIEKRLVMVFASDTVREATIDSPTDGMVTYLSDTQGLEIFDGVSWRPVLDVVAPACHAFVSGTQTAANNTWHTVSFDAENYDTVGMHGSLNPTRITVPTAGLYQVNASVTFSFSQASQTYRDYSNARALQVRKNAGANANNGTQVLSTISDAYARVKFLLFDLPVISGFGTRHTVSESSMDVRLNAGDYLEMFVFQTSGLAATLASGAVSTYLQVRRVSS